MGSEGISDTDDFNKAYETVNNLLKGLKRAIMGRDDTLKLLVTALMADGHVLVEDYPGSGKTTMTKTLGGLIKQDNDSQVAPYSRIQFTPDMLPGDVLGVTVFNRESNSFHFNPGPVFANIVLADEINRTGPKVQAAFLECMAEKQVTIDNATYKLDDLFFVVGTQNPLDIAGTYPLPIVQLDRFLLKIPMGYVNEETELQILEEHGAIKEASSNPTSVCTRTDVLEARRMADKVTLNQNLRRAMVEIVQATRGNPLLRYGASTRAALMLQAATKAYALVNSRNYATEDDLKFIAPYVLLHRLSFQTNDSKGALEELMAPAMEGLIGGAL